MDTKGDAKHKEDDESSSSTKNSAWMDMEALKREFERLEFVDTLEYENVILGASMESWLKRFAILLTNTEPTFLKESTIMDGCRQYYRYHVLLNTNIIGDHPFTIGRYAESEFFAREDAAVEMIKRLLAATNKQVFDFNYHNLAKQNEVMDSLQAQNWELTEENQRLKEEICVLRERFCRFNV
ncbi:hypothetical protein RIF29_09171 [Crotalaria pallida]|uniref:Uncharacterized protein n=1 Tax=Crotalaria pallida TaxID=3830 RepID=A0AAN9FRJ7_CROPI